MMKDITAAYSPAEAWIYDRVIAPAVADFAEMAQAEVLGDALSGELRAVLDVGCGGGQIAAAIAERRPEVRVTGLDLSPDQIARATRRGAHLGDRVSFVVGSALELPFPDARFDAVYSVASIKHWPDPARGLAECVRVLRPGGLLVVVEGDRGCRYEDARRFMERLRVPRPVSRLFLPVFRTWVVGHAPDLDDARALLRPLPLDGREVRRIEGTPGLLMKGRRALPPASS